MTTPSRANALLVKALVAGGTVLVLTGLTLFAFRSGEMVFWGGIMAAGLLDLGAAAFIAKRS